jgi:predicted nucleotidyltransferase component of viral defense system
MLTANQLRQVAGRSGARDIGNVEIDVILTYLLQLFAEKGIMDHVGFKGGTMLRKMVFGRAVGFQPISISHAIRISAPRI